MCDESRGSTLVTSFAVVYGVPLVLALTSRFIPDACVGWAKKLQKDATNRYMVERLDFFAAFASAKESLLSKAAHEVKKRAAGLGEGGSEEDEKLTLKKLAVMDYFRMLLRHRHHYWGLPPSLFPDGKLNTWFGEFQFPLGYLEDFLFYLCNTNPILGGVLAHPDHPITPRAHRAIYAVTHSLGLFMYISVLTNPNATEAQKYLVNYFVVVPWTVVLDRLVFYLVGCPCFYDADKGSKTYQKAAKAAGCISILAQLGCFLFSLIFVIVAGLSARHVCIVMDYLWSNLVVVAMLDVIKSLPRYFLGTPIGFKACDFVLVNTGDWLLEREQERRFVPGRRAANPDDHTTRIHRICRICCCCCCQVVSYEPFLAAAAGTGAGAGEGKDGESGGGEHDAQADEESGTLTVSKADAADPDDHASRRCGLCRLCCGCCCCCCCCDSCLSPADASEGTNSKKGKNSSGKQNSQVVNSAAQASVTAV